MFTICRILNSSCNCTSKLPNLFRSETHFAQNPTNNTLREIATIRARDCIDHAEIAYYQREAAFSTVDATYGSGPHTRNRILLSGGIIFSDLLMNFCHHGRGWSLRPMDRSMDPCEMRPTCNGGQFGKGGGPPSESTKSRILSVSGCSLA